MNSYILAGISVVGGAIAGSLTTLFIVKNKYKIKYEKLAQEKIDEMVNAFRSNPAPMPVEPEKKEEEPKKDDILDKPLLDYSSIYPSPKKEETEVKYADQEPPRVKLIRHDDINGVDESEITLIEYYQNDILAYGIDGEKLNDGEIDRILGRESLKAIRNTNKDALYFWNDELQRYYEVDIMFSEYPDDGD